MQTNNQWLKEKNSIIKSPQDVRITTHIDTELNLIQEELKSIKGHKTKSRKTRSLINFGGRVLNFLFGTMDDEDKKEIETKLKTLDFNNHELITNNNKQVAINIQLQEDIGIVKKLIDTKINNNAGLSKDLKFIEKRIVILEYTRRIDKLKEIIEKIQRLVLASRLQIMTDSLLTAKEIEFYDVDLFKLRNIKLSLGEYDNDFLIFIIQIPDKIYAFDKYFITSIPNEEKMELDIRSEDIIKINDTFYKYCENKELKHLKPYTNCINKNNCLKRKNEEINIVKELKKGTLIVKNSDYNIKNSCDERKIVKIKRNVLINFENCNIEINNKEYVSKNPIVNQPINMYMEDTFNLKEINLKIEDYNLARIENINKIVEKVSDQSNVHFGINGILIVIICAILIILYKKLFQEKQESSGGGVIESLPNPDNIRTVPSIFA